MSKKHEYKGDVFILGLCEGGGLSDVTIDGFSGFPDAPVRKPHKQIRFFVKVVGFCDERAPSRNWGFTMDDFTQLIYKTQRISERLFKKLTSSYKI